MLPFDIFKGRLRHYHGHDTHVTLPNGIIGISDSAFPRSCPIEELTLPPSCLMISIKAFARCRRLRAVHVHPLSPFFREVDGALYDDAHETLLYWPCAKPFTGLPPTVRQIYRNAMYGHSAVTLDIPEGVETIADSAFMDCVSLTSVTLPSSLRTIEQNAFAGCMSLETVVLPNGLQSIGTDAFKGCALRTLHLPASLTAFDAEILGKDSTIGTITVDPANACLTAVGGVLYDKAVTKLLFCPSPVRELVLPDTVTQIAAQALQSCHMLTSLTLPESLEQIEPHAFDGCTSLRTLTFPDSFRGNGWQSRFRRTDPGRTIRFCGVDIPEGDISDDRRTTTSIYSHYDRGEEMPPDDVPPFFERVHAFLHGSTDVWFDARMRLWLAWNVYRRGDRSPAITAMIAPQRGALLRRLLEERDEAALTEAVAAFPPDDDDLDPLLAMAEEKGARACWIVLVNEKRRRGSLAGSGMTL